MTAAGPHRRGYSARMLVTCTGIAAALGAVVAVAWGVGPDVTPPSGADAPLPRISTAQQLPAPASTATMPTTPAGAEALPQPVWSDEFTGPAGAAPAPDRWRAVTGGDGFGNDELECNTDDRRNSSLDGTGHLVITARAEAGFQCMDGHRNDYFSARLSTQGLHAQAYGKVRVRAQLPSAPGLWPAIWALGADNPTVGWPWSGEIDIAEAVGKAPSTIYQTVHGPTYSGRPYALDHASDLGAPVGDGFHVYGLDWTPDRVSFSVDGHPTGTVTRAEVERHGYWVFDKPFYLLLDLAVGGSFPGPPTAATTFPQSMVVDYVRVYQ